MTNDDLIFCADTVQRMTTRKPLGEKFMQYMREHKTKGIEDQFGNRARLALFMFDIKPSRKYSAEYRTEYFDIHQYDYEVPCQKEIEQLVKDYGWVNFLQALEWFAVNRLKVYMRAGKVAYRIDQVSKFVEKIKAIPKWLK